MKSKISAILAEALGAPVDISEEAREEFGHYVTPAALRMAKLESRPPKEVAGELVKKIEASAPGGFFRKLEVAGPGFINMHLTDEAIQKEFEAVASDESFGRLDILAGQRIMVEYTDPNPFKQFHIGHLMTNVIGEALARVHEAAGAEVLRVNYQGDVGLHVAMSLWGMGKLQDSLPKESDPLSAKSAYLGRAYALGAKALKEDEGAKAEIEELNKKIYAGDDPQVRERYETGRRWSLEYFETIYERLGTKFVHYFFESEVGPEGLRFVREHPDVFVESEGAVIFPGEKYGLHTRVFVNRLGLPVYEAKELALNIKKFALYQPDLSIVVTGNEINDYFRVLLKAMELTVPEIAKRTRHIGHGMLRLPTGKMSSRTGDVLTMDNILDTVRAAVAEKIAEREGLEDADKEMIQEQVAQAALRYSILRQGVGRDIIFDINTSVAFHGESGPYLQYTYARLRRVLAKAGKVADADASLLTTAHELRLMRRIFAFPDEVRKCAADLSLNSMATYLYELSNLANRFYEDQPILTDENGARRAARLVLADMTTRVLRDGLNLLGIRVLEAI